MQKYDLAIAIRIGSSQSTVALVQTTFESIMSNIGECKYRFIISTDPDIPKSVKNYVSSLVSSEKTRIEFLGEEKIYWSEFINKAIEASQDCKYFIVAHDDIQVITKNFYRKTLNKIERIEEPAAWISFDDAGYTFGLWSPPTRSGYFSDRIDGWAKRKLFQFHNLPDCWWKLSATERLRNKTVNLLRPLLKKNALEYHPISEKDLNFPTQPVKCHAPWNMFVMIKTSVLHELGPCEHWNTFNALLVDEDWGLRAMQKKRWNIWIPNVKYIHMRSNVKGGGNRSQQMVMKDLKRVGSLFRKKWGFSSNPTEDELLYIKKTYSNSFIPWSINRLSYSWDSIH